MKRMKWAICTTLRGKCWPEWESFSLEGLFCSAYGACSCSVEFHESNIYLFRAQRGFVQTHTAHADRQKGRQRALSQFGISYIGGAHVGGMSPRAVKWYGLAILLTNPSLKTVNTTCYSACQTGPLSFHIQSEVTTFNFLLFSHRIFSWFLQND